MRAPCGQRRTRTGARHRSAISQRDIAARRRSATAPFRAAAKVVASGIAAILHSDRGTFVDALRARAARRLEAGARGSALIRAASRTWSEIAARSISRPLALPAGARVIAVGGAVLGGAGKTPVAIAIARALADSRQRVALIGHAYRARPGRPREVGPDDPASDVGDDALAAARLLGDAARVIVAPRRQGAIDLAAATGAETLVIDGLLQAAPRRVAASILVLDGLAPWGSGACPPAGDLRAPRDALLGAADVVAALLPEGSAGSPDLPAGAIALPSRVDGARSASGARRSLADLRALRCGLLVAIARPGRVEAALARSGVVPAITISLADHAFFSRSVLARAEAARIDVWLTTERCAVKLPSVIGGAEVLALEHRVDVGPLLLALRALLRALPALGG